ncbi:SH3 domain-containing protein [Campylobacter mucosalis]|uniref:SH3 domain-containing protein n=1 Tax=Campylobacter mucosalis TaxID=202 RepID=UPI00147024FA|nr:SH3 domain-containing protein [Campylobacter mucosalis]
MVKLALFILTAIFAFATSSNEPSVFDMMDRSQDDKLVYKPSQNKQPIINKNTDTNQKAKISPDELKNIVPTDEPDLNIPDSQIYDVISKKEAVLKATKVPKSAFVGEIFSVEILLDSQSDLDFEFETDIDDSNFKFLNKKDIEWVKQSDGKYIATLVLQAKSSATKSLKINVSLKRNDQEYQNASMNVFLPKFKEIRSKSDFNNIVADILEVKKFKTTKFDENSLIMIVELSGKNIDLASFYIEDKTILKQGVDTIVGSFASQSAYYFAVFKPNKRTLDFSYYNLSKSKFESFSLPVSIEDDEISTQIGLNPKQSEFSIYKNITLYSLSVIFFILTLIRRKVSYLITTAIFIALSVYTYNPFSKGILKANVSVKILPTERSTIFYTSIAKENIEILNERADYVKILFSDGKIGWVKKDDIIKN